MNARQAANTERWALEDAAARQGHSCLLCGGRVPAFEVDGELHVWELCSACNAAFSAAADRVAAATAARLEGPAAAAVVQLVGQLELEDGEYLVPPFEDRLGDVLAAIRSGDWTGVPTMTIGDAVRHHADGFTRAELAEMRQVLGRRS